MKFFLIAVLVAVASADDGQYRPEVYGSGQYVHQDSPYKHVGVDSGKYVHQDSPYKHVGSDSGKYVHQDSPYKHTGGQGGQYVHQVPATPVVQPVQPRVVTSTYNNEGGWKILQDDRQLSPAGSADFAYEYLTENKIHAREQQQAIAPASQQATGFYEYVGDDGQQYRVEYTAGENGFQPQGAHLPVAPEVPVAIARSVEYQLRNARV